LNGLLEEEFLQVLAIMQKLVDRTNARRENANEKLMRKPEAKKQLAKFSTTVQSDGICERHKLD